MLRLSRDRQIKPQILRYSLRCASSHVRSLRMLGFTLTLIGAWAASPAASQSHCDVRHGIDISFSHSASALLEAERDKIAKEITRIRDANYCPFVGVKVVGHASIDEGNALAKSQIAIERAAYVVKLLDLSGIPKETIASEAKSDTQPAYKTPSNRNARVEVQVQAGCPAREKPCMFPMAPSGFRLPN